MLRTRSYYGHLVPFCLGFAVYFQTNIIPELVMFSRLSKYFQEHHKTHLPFYFLDMCRSRRLILTLE